MELPLLQVIVSSCLAAECSSCTQKDMIVIPFLFFFFPFHMLTLVTAYMAIFNLAYFSLLLSIYMYVKC